MSTGFPGEGMTMTNDENPLADLLLTHEHVYLLDEADFEAFTAQLQRARADREEIAETCVDAPGD